MSSLDPLGPLPDKWADPEYVQRQLAELEDCRKLACERARRLHAIEDLHEPVPAKGGPLCSECSADVYEEEAVSHPCATVRLANGEEI